MEDMKWIHKQNKIVKKIGKEEKRTHMRLTNRKQIEIWHT